jgi:biopolymer transport protein ExbD
MNNYKKKRAIRKFKKENKEVLELDITSLLDILVILLVFLLKSYNASDLTIDLAQQVTLPDSRSSVLGNQSIIVQVNRNRDIFINNKLVGTYIGKSERIAILYKELKDHKQLIEAEISSTRKPANVTEKDIRTRKKDRLKKVNIVLDKSLPYSVLSKVMHTAASAGFPEFKFIVQGKYE